MDIAPAEGENTKKAPIYIFLDKGGGENGELVSGFMLT